MACIALQSGSPSICTYQECSLCFSAHASKAVLEVAGMVQTHPARILADTGAGLSIVSDSFINRHKIPTKSTKTRSVHGVTRHQLAINQAAILQVAVGQHQLGNVEASVADTADYDLILGYSELKRLRPTIQWETGQLQFKVQDPPTEWGSRSRTAARR